MRTFNTSVSYVYCLESDRPLVTVLSSFVASDGVRLAAFTPSPVGSSAIHHLLGFPRGYLFANLPDPHPAATHADFPALSFSILPTSAKAVTACRTHWQVRQDILRLLHVPGCCSRNFSTWSCCPGCSHIFEG